jgi:hypothetical protein
MGSPIISVPPSFYEPPYVCERGTVGPLGVVDFVRKSGIVQLSLEKGKRLLRDGNLKGLLLIGHDKWG